MTISPSLLKCRTLQELDLYITPLPRVTIGPWGGRKFLKGKQAFSLNQLVAKLLALSKQSPKEPATVKKLIGKIRQLDNLPDPSVSLLRNILTTIRRLFGNIFFDRNRALNELESRLPKAHTPPAQRRLPSKKASASAVIPATKASVRAESNLLKGWLINPNQKGTSTLRLFRDIREVRASPYTPNTSLEGLLMQCTPDHKVDLQEESSLLLLLGIFKFCVLTQIQSQYGKKQEDLFDWLSQQPTLGAKTVDAAIQGYLSRTSWETAPLLRLLSMTKMMKENPDSLGEAFAKLVELHANSNELERLIEYFIKEERISFDEYQFILVEFKKKRGQAGKAGMSWKVLDLLQTYANQKGWLNSEHPFFFR